MQPFKFKLDGLLKLREFKEDQIRNELAEIVSRMNQARSDIILLNKEIDQAYVSQDKVYASADSAQLARFFGYFIQGKREHIKDKEATLYSLGKKYTQKSAELAQAMGEVKVVEGLKEKKYQEYKHEYDKREQEKIEEFVIMGHKSRGEL